MSLADPSIPDLADIPPGPIKCTDHDAPGVPRNDCTEPGSRLKCQLCPASPTYWRRHHGYE